MLDIFIIIPCVSCFSPFCSICERVQFSEQICKIQQTEKFELWCITTMKTLLFLRKIDKVTGLYVWAPKNLYDLNILHFCTGLVKSIDTLCSICNGLRLLNNYTRDNFLGNKSKVLRRIGNFADFLKMGVLGGSSK